MSLARIFTLPRAVASTFSTPLFGRPHDFLLLEGNGKLLILATAQDWSLLDASVHTLTMTLKNAALLALIGTILMTALLVWTFVFNFLQKRGQLSTSIFNPWTTALSFYTFSIGVS
jgi:hypothetical protein